MSPPVLSHPVHHQLPFPFFLCTEAFEEGVLEMFERLFSEGKDWQLHDAEFYKCFLRVCTTEVPAQLLRETAGRMREITGLPLTDEVLVTAQRVMPGQSIGVHSDRPLLGYEVARLVVHLNAGWQPEHGGLLELFEQPDADAAEQWDPIRNVAFGFVLHEGSHHAVSEATRVRRSVVFNFWHAANTPELDTAVRALLEDMHFSELPPALDGVASAAEASLPEDTTYRADVTAMVLHRWGYQTPVVVAGYEFSAGLSGTAALAEEARCAVQLAAWIARLHRDAFEPAAWTELRGALHGVGPFERLQPFWNLCLP